jgi:hypothetical protein
MKLETAKKKYKGQWLAFKYTDEKRGLGEVAFHHKNPDELHKFIMASDRKVVFYQTFAGPVLPPKTFALL